MFVGGATATSVKYTMLRRLVTSKKPLVIVPVVLALVLAGLFLPVEVSIEPYGVLSLESKITISIGYEVAYASPGWVSPTGFVDGVWTDEAFAYDEDTGTYAVTTIGVVGWSDDLELTVAELQCDKVQIWSSMQASMDLIEVDVYYGSAWHNIYSGSLTTGAYVEYPIGSTQSVTAMRIRYHATKANRWVGVNEADFNEVSLAPDITNAPTSKDFGTVSESTPYWSNGSAPVWPLDDTECYFTVTNNSSSAVNIDIRATDFSGGTPSWTLGATPDADTVTLKAGKVPDAEGDLKTLTTVDQPFITGLDAATSLKWELKMETPTSFSNGDPKTSTVTLTATFP